MNTHTHPKTNEQAYNVLYVNNFKDSRETYSGLVKSFLEKNYESHDNLKLDISDSFPGQPEDYKKILFSSDQLEDYLEFYSGLKKTMADNDIAEKLVFISDKPDSLKNTITRHWLNPENNYENTLLNIPVVSNATQLDDMFDSYKQD